MGAFDGLRALERVCDDLGLRAEQSVLTTRYAGVVSGVGVAVERIAGRSGDADTVVVARPPRQPDLGLHVRGASMVPWVGATMATGDGAFDGIFHTRCPASEEAAARRLLDRSVTAPLRRLANTGWPALTDDAVAFELSLLGTTADELRARVGWCVECALAVADRAAALDAPHPLQRTGVAAAFEAAARARGLAFARNAMRAEGVAGRGHLTVRWRTRAPIPLTHGAPDDARVGWRARLAFDEPLGVGLRAHPATLVERVRSAVGLRDLQTGDADFDRAWTLAARDEPGALSLLHPGARRLLTQLAALGLRVALDDASLTLEGDLPTAPEGALRALDLLDGARDALRPAMSVGPYR